MHAIVWRFTTDNSSEFERHYGAEGSWAQLFRRSADYVRTDLLTDGECYLTIDWWRTRNGLAKFKVEHGADYAALDRVCEALTRSEEKVGEFEER
jgi:hypothetical protein